MGRRSKIDRRNGLANGKSATGGDEMVVADRNLRGLCWSVAVYYLVLMLVVFAVHSPARTGATTGEAVGTAAGAPILAILLFFAGLSIINVWIASGVVVGVLAGLVTAVVRLRGELRIAAVLAILTAMNL